MGGWEGTSGSEAFAAAREGGNLGAVRPRSSWARATSAVPRRRAARRWAADTDFSSHGEPGTSNEWAYACPNWFDKALVSAASAVLGYVGKSFMDALKARKVALDETLNRVLCAAFLASRVLRKMGQPGSGSCA